MLKIKSLGIMALAVMCLVGYGSFTISKLEVQIVKQDKQIKFELGQKDVLLTAVEELESTSVDESRRYKLAISELGKLRQESIDIDLAFTELQDDLSKLSKSKG